jgi:hypothetical protein
MYAHGCRRSRSPAGRLCASATIQPGDCTRGHYVSACDSNERVVTTTPVVAAAYRCVSSMINLTTFFVQCPRGTPLAIPCDAGTFSSSTTLSSAEECEVCPLGHACALGTSVPELCAAGQYGATRGQTTTECTGPCSPGHYCVAGSTDSMSGVCRAPPVALPRIRSP